MVRLQIYGVTQSTPLLKPRVTVPVLIVIRRRECVLNPRGWGHGANGQDGARAAQHVGVGYVRD